MLVIVPRSYKQQRFIRGKGEKEVFPRAGIPHLNANEILGAGRVKQVKLNSESIISLHILSRMSG